MKPLALAAALLAIAPANNADFQRLCAEGEDLAHQVFTAEVMPGGGDLVLISNQSGGLRGVVVGPGRALHTLPDINPNGRLFQVSAVSFPDIDTDPELEILVMIESMTGIGPEGARPFNNNVLLDWDGASFVRVDAPEISEVRTVAAANQALEQRRAARSGPRSFETAGWSVEIDAERARATRGGASQALWQNDDGPGDQGSWNHLLSAVGPYLSVQNSWYYEGGAHPSYGALWKAISLDTGNEVPLTQLFPEATLLPALHGALGQWYQGEGRPGSLRDLLDNLDGDCEIDLDESLLHRWAFSGTRGEEVIVTLGLSYGAEVCRGAFHRFDLTLPVPGSLADALRRAEGERLLLQHQTVPAPE